MTDFGWLFLHTPVPYLAAMYIVAYRHDLGRIVHPFRDTSSSSEWYSVCRQLGLVSATTTKPARERPVGGARNIVLVVVSVEAYAASVFASFFLPWYLLCAIQALVAVPLFALVVLNRTGPFPSRPYRDVLPYPRLGTRVRHVLGRVDAEGREAKPPISTTTGGRN